MVHLNEDGTSSVSALEVSVEEQEAALARRAGLPVPSDMATGTVSQAISVDSSCPDAAMWMFSGKNLTGNSICFIGGGTAKLRDYLMYPRVCRGRTCNDGPRYWDHNVLSYWAGDSDGYFIKDNGGTNSFTYRKREDAVLVPTYTTLVLSF